MGRRFANAAACNGPILRPFADHLGRLLIVVLRPDFAILLEQAVPNVRIGAVAGVVAVH